MHRSVFNFFQWLSNRICPDTKIQQNKETAGVQQKGAEYFNICRENYYCVQ